MGRAVANRVLESVRVDERQRESAPALSVLVRHHEPVRRGLETDPVVDDLEGQPVILQLPAHHDVVPPVTEGRLHRVGQQFGRSDPGVVGVFLIQEGEHRFGQLAAAVVRALNRERSLPNQRCHFPSLLIVARLANNFPEGEGGNSFGEVTYKYGSSSM